MHETPEPHDPGLDSIDSAIETAVEFLTALFVEADLILFRPIEIWVEGTKKCSRVSYRHISYRTPILPQLKLQIFWLLQAAEQHKLNLFFSVCPRAGDRGRFDLAWQIRTVRVLWADIDQVSVAEALERVAKANLPPPSIIVNSGNGVHLYWLLDIPYLIDDAGDPLPVETEWVEQSSGRKKPRKYILENGDKVYLDQRRHVSRLSIKAQYIQDILAGIAQALGGDHTKDLTRLLRIPGTLNRKDQRNGREPVPTVLIELNAQLKYPLASFESFKINSPETERAKQIAAMPLPKLRKLSPSKSDKLAKYVAACLIASVGARSEADFALCCFAIRNGIAREEVWQLVERVGKFAELGRRYFDVTWTNAEFDVQAGFFDEQLRLAATNNKRPSPLNAVDSLGAIEAANNNGGNSRDRPTIIVDPATMPVADVLCLVTDRLLAAGNCFARADQLVVINNQQILPILTSAELAGLLNQHVEFYYFVGEEKAEYKPFPRDYSNTWLNHRGERARLPIIKLFTNNPVFSDDYRLVASGFDPESGFYYAGPVIEARAGTEYLDRLLKDFCFKTTADRTNYLAMLLTILLVPRFIGSKPAVLFNGNQPGLGKSMLAQIIAILRDGHTAETASYNPNDEEFEKRLGAIVRHGTTTIIIDNAKNRGRSRRIESACLERSITDPIVSFRLLGHSASIRAKNSHIFCITANSPEVSRDLITRSLVVNLFHEGDPQRRKFSIVDPEGYTQQHRVELLGELIGMVERWKVAGMLMANVNTRFNKRNWGNVIGGILASAGQKDFLGNSEESAVLLDATRGEFAELVTVLATPPKCKRTAAQLVELSDSHALLQRELGKGTTHSRTTRMGLLASRYVSERFSFSDDCTAIFQRSNDGKVNEYSVEIVESTPDV